MGAGLEEWQWILFENGALVLFSGQISTCVNDDYQHSMSTTFVPDVKEAVRATQESQDTRRCVQPLPLALTRETGLKTKRGHFKAKVLT